MKPIQVNEHLIIRLLCEDDIAPIVAAEIEQGWDAAPDKLMMRLAHAEAGHATPLCAVWDGVPVGYVSLYDGPKHGPFVGCGYPEIVDFNVIEKYRRRGIGSALLGVCEDMACAVSDTVTLGVGLHSGYGAAQRLYVQRGYVPDGSGVWYNDAICEPYTVCENGDGLVLYLSKKLK